jgi:hypothetical protein
LNNVGTVKAMGTFGDRSNAFYFMRWTWALWFKQMCLMSSWEDVDLW